MRVWLAITTAMLLTCVFPCTTNAADWHAEGKKGAVVAGGPKAVDAGMEILRAGGNAIDSAVATLLALSVTDSGAYCFGGEVPILVYNARRGCVEVLAGQGVAPRLATREYFAARGGIPGSGIEPAAVPAVLDVCITALERHGRMSFTEVIAPTLRLLDSDPSGWHGDLAKTFRRLIIAEHGATKDRIRGLRLVADEFYRGDIAREIAAWSEANGGLIRYEDLATHVTRIEEPLSIDYRGYTVYKCGTWTQGPYFLQTLKLLEGFDLHTMGHNRAQTIHTVIEAMKLALADRDTYYADPLFEDVPIDALLSDEYTAKRRELIDPERASLKQRPGDPHAGKPLLGHGPGRTGPGGANSDTTTCLVADSEGNVVAATPSGWSGVVAGSTGVVLGTRLQSFNAWEGHPNCIAPGKRPRITLTPTLVSKNNRPVLAISVAGGDGQDQASLQLFLNAVEFGQHPAAAVTSARFGTSHLVGSFRQPPPKLGSLTLYHELANSLGDALRAKGHKVQTTGAPLWAPSLLTIDEEGTIRVAGDPKARRHAAAY